MFLQTRRRLAIWYTTVTAIVLLVFASGMYIYVRGTLIERIDDTLNHVVEVVNRSLTIDRVSPAQLTIDVAGSFQDNSDRVEDDRIDLELFGFDRRLLWSTVREPLNLPVHVNPDGETVRVDRDRILRQICVPVMRQGQLLGFLRVSHPWFEVTKPTEQLIVDLSVGTIVTVGTVAAIGWLLSGIAIEPVTASYQQLKQFTADASHELRNPIATIQTNVQVALSEEPLPASQRQQLQTIERLTRRLSRLVDDLLFLARQDSGLVPPQFAAVPLDALLMEAIEEQQLVATAKGIDLALEIVDSQVNGGSQDPEDFTIDGDWDRLARLFTNLITNAIQSMPVKLDRPAQIKAILQRINKQNQSFLQVKIKDTGIGIAAEDIPYLCDRFYRVDTARTAVGTEGGSGLGLAIAQAIVNNHHGELKIDSQLNVGTIVSVNLPMRV